MLVEVTPGALLELLLPEEPQAAIVRAAVAATAPGVRRLIVRDPISLLSQWTYGVQPAERSYFDTPSLVRFKY
jgi:hypothetical protein